MFYFKKIVSYFDYYEYGEKKKSCGYAKIIVKDHDMTLEVRLKGLPVKGTGTYELITAGGQKRRLGQFSMEHGTGCFYACFHTMDLDGSGLSAFAVGGLSVPIGDDRACETAWNWGLLPDISLFERSLERQEGQAGVETVQEQAASGREKGQAGVETVQEQAASGREKGQAGVETVQEQAASGREKGQAGVETVQERAASGREKEQKAPAQPEEQMSGGKEKSGAAAAETAETELGSRLFSEFRSESGRIQKDEEIPQQEILHEDKWRQLRTLYPVCHPFGEHEDYIVIAPKDFIVLRREYQNLVSNSFLLHSFYNYHHVILGKMGGDEDGNYYIGVPGNYFEREKKVAVMFGFEGFAQSERRNDTTVTKKGGQTTVETGAFGYYMKQVEI